MSKSIATLTTMKPVPPEDLEKLHTGSLLTRLHGLRSLHASFETSDWSPEARDAVEAAGLVAFKDTEIWQTAFQNLKQRLSRREHFPRAGKSRDRQWRKQNRNFPDGTFLGTFGALNMPPPAQARS